MINVMLLIVMTLMGALGGFFLKKASDLMTKFNKQFFIYLFIGGTLYLIGASLNIILLKFLPYSLVYPLTSITYIWTLLFSILYLKEKTSLLQIIGVAVIICGTIILII